MFYRYFLQYTDRINPCFGILLVFVIICFHFTVNSQNLPVVEKTMYIDSAGIIYIHEKMPVYLLISSESEPENKHLLKSHSQHTNPMYMDGHGEHFIIHHDPITGRQTDHRIFADGLSPVSEIFVTEGLKLQFDDIFYCRESVKIEIRAQDAHSGMKNSYYSFDGNNFEIYSEPIQISDKRFNKIYFFSVDNVGNVEKISEADFIFNLEDVIDLENIYFAFDSYFLNHEARRQLNQLARTLRDFPGVIVELRSHTDAIGPSDYNLILSERRSASVRNYIISRGVSHSRLVPKGLGDSELLNHCLQGVECTEEEHSVNRRTEFRIVPIDEY